VEQSCRSLPYGNGMSCTPGPTEHLFTEQERDEESGNDYFMARHYNSNTGRFLSPDPSGLSLANPINPQTFNHYAYVGNNPLSYTDSTGLSIDCDGAPDPSVVCMVTSAWDWLKNLLGGSGNDSDDGGDDPLPQNDPMFADDDQQQMQAAGGTPPLGPAGTALTAQQMRTIVTDAQKLAAGCERAFSKVIPDFSLAAFDSEIKSATYNQYPTPYSGPPHGSAEAEAISRRHINLYADFFRDTSQRKAAIIVHEDLHGYTGWSDGNIFFMFQHYGLPHNEFINHQGTDEITRWILNGCR
jgi:RHS repeat-associated protein